MGMTVDGALPERLTLKPQLLPYCHVGVAFVLVIALAILRIPEDMVTPVDGQKARWLLAICSVVFFAIGFFSIRTPTRLDVEGLVDANGRRHAWKDCSEFEIDETKVGRLVLSDVRAMSSETGKVVVWGNFGMTNADLAVLLNRFRARALGLND